MGKNSLFQTFFNFLERYLPFISIGFFLLGIGLAKVSSSFANLIDKGISGFVNSYGLIAPIAIYAILTPSIMKIAESRQQGDRRFIGYVLLWFAKLRIVACLWAALFTTLVFGFPLYLNGNTGLFSAIAKSLSSLAWMLTHSSYFYAIYASIITVILSAKFPRFFRFMGGWTEMVENLGKVFIPIVPVFLLAIGSYVCNLPNNIAEQIGNVSGATLNTFTVLGLKINSATSGGMIMAYLAGAFLTGIACMVWHFALLFLAKPHTKGFSIKKYFKNYWAKVYPLLWSTSSEALATPLNLYLVQKHYPGKNPNIRRFVVGVGSYMNINGTVICVFVLAGLVAKILGIQLSFLQLVMITPVVFLIAYGVPGIPGELLLFGGPIVLLFNLNPVTTPIFLALYLGLQIGLPDSFRTGANSTDGCPSFMILDSIYEKRFASQPRPEVATLLLEPEIVLEQAVKETEGTSVSFANESVLDKAEVKI